MIGARPVHARRRRIQLAVLLLGGLLMLGRAVQIQVLEGAAWAARAEDQHRERLTMPAPRGTIYDRNGVPLAATREAYRIAIAPRELRDPRAAAGRLVSALGLTDSAARRAVDTRRRWVVLPGRWDAVVRERLEGVRGVHFERVMERFYPHGDLARELLGRVNAEGRPLGGLELELEGVLRGEPGQAVVRREATGRPIPGAMLAVEAPRPGEDVVLTLDLQLQEIADEALRSAVAEYDARGGDLLMADPRTGEILAAASLRGGDEGTWRGVTDPYEPGSTLKPFVAAALLAGHHATLADTVFAEEGAYRHGGRLIRDEHEYGWLTLADVLRYSSNIGMAKLSQRLAPREHYAYLRDFGFGTPTGVAYPTESGGLLERPAQWSGYSQASLAIGYEIGVTPLQMTMAYAALANGGVLMEPRVVREVRTRDGRVQRRSEPRAVRRVVPEQVAREITGVLVDVVEEGTGTRAGLGAFRVAGKTGTARSYGADGYERGRYTASFAGFFPAEDPQLVVLVKLDGARQYGGGAAAPVTGATLAAALAVHSSPLDRRAVARTVADPGAVGRVGWGDIPSSSASWPDPAPGPFIFAIDDNEPDAPRSSAATRLARVPDVRGDGVRNAARRLHEAGFGVRLKGSGRVRLMWPVPGDTRPRGAVVEIIARERR